MDLVDRLARARIGATHNQYAESELRCARLREYLAARRPTSIVLVGEAAGYRGARVSGIAFTSERQLTGGGPAEASATIVHRVLAELGIEDDVLLWNVVPTHPGHGDLEPAPDARRGSRRASVPRRGDARPRVASSPSVASPPACSTLRTSGIRRTAARTTSPAGSNVHSPR